MRGWAEFTCTRKELLAAVPSVGWGLISPADGAFYLYAGLADSLGSYPDSTAWAAALLEQVGVVAPGSDFDPGGGGCYVRFSFAARHDAVLSAIERIQEFQRRTL